MTFEGITFVDENCKNKTEAEFIEHEKHSGLTVKQLKEAYAIMVPKKKVTNDNKGVTE